MGRERDISVIGLGYIGICSPEPADWRTLLTDVIGAQIVEGAGKDRMMARVDERAWRIAIERGERGLAYAGWEVPNAKALAALVARLREAGHEVVEDRALAEERGVLGLARLRDPAGQPIELFYGASVARTPFISPTQVTFLTGQLGLGHVVFSVPSLAETEAFYGDILGFSISDEVKMGPVHSKFMHCNPRHHSLAFAAIPGFVGMHHFMLEVDSLDSVGLAFDRAKKLQIPLSTTIGKHSNDHMISFFVDTPSGIVIEYGYGGRMIDNESWTVSTYSAPHIWGQEVIGDAREARVVKEHLD